MQQLFPTDLRQQLARFQELIRFGLVGLSGVLVNTLMLWVLAQRLGLAVPLASVLATEVAIISNFLLNDRWTFSGRHTRSFIQRLLRYNSVAIGGLVITTGVLTFLTSVGALPLLVANLVAVLVAMAWNYTLSSRWTWHRATGASQALPTEAVVGEALPLERAVGDATSGAAQAARQTSAPLMLPGYPVGTGLANHTLTAGGSLGALAVLGCLGWLVLGLPGAWAALAALLLSVTFVSRPGVSTRQAGTMILATAAGISTINYLAWRAGVIGWSAWWIGLPLFVAELFGALHTFGLQYTAWPRSALALGHDEDPTQRPIFVFIPTVDEGPPILAPTLRGALAAQARYLQRFPHGRVTIVVCNDGYVAGAQQWRATEELCRQLGVRCVTREVGGGAKAGNIEHARQQVGGTGDALLVIFDADQIATPDALLQLVAPMADANVGWVQSGQYYSNLTNPVSRWANDQQGLFYKLLCPGKAAQNAAFICGTNVMLRAAALDEIGGLPQDSVTEDFAASIKLHPRWRSVFLSDELAHGMGPLSLSSYFKQQGRWATGTLSVLRTHWREIVLPQRGGLSFPQRLQYALACTHYLSGVRDLIYLVAPLVFLVLGVAAVQGTYLDVFLWHFLPYWLLSQIAFWRLGWGKTSMRGIVLGFASFPVLISSLVTVIAGRRVAFTVTAKRREASGVLRQVRPHLLALVACALALVVSALSGRHDASAQVSAMWVLYTMAMLGGVVWLAVADYGHAQERAPRLRRPALAPWVRPLRPALIGTGVVLALGALVSFGPLNGRAVPPAPFVPRQELGKPYFGVALPYDMVGSRPAQLEQELGLTFAIVGRTQDIRDRFDSAWAEQLYATGGQPWVTLLFAVPEQPSYESSLTAIANGFHDAQLRTWAQAMRTYGRPVYLSILPHVDRNWSSSSAVANGGIPQDTPRAWNHVRTILQQEGAANVAMVWSPADPTNDADYAPPPSSIDVVLLSLISYPDQEWVNPVAAIAATEAAHPGTPLLVEVSAAGEPARKAAWLESVGAAVAQRPAVHALLYHDGAPNPKATSSEHARWSMTSDEQTLAAMRAVVDDAELRASVVAHN